jgi:hypothetical protein
MVRVADAEFDPQTGEVRRDGIVTRLEPQPAAVLTLLSGRPGELVSHEEIRRAIWGDTTHVNFQQSLHYCVRQIRRALEDNSSDKRIIETVPRRGYRLRPIPAPDPVARGRAWMAWTTAALVLTGVALAVAERRPNNHHQVAVAVLRTVHDLVY